MIIPYTPEFSTLNENSIISPNDTGLLYPGISNLVLSVISTFSTSMSEITLCKAGDQFTKSLSLNKSFRSCSLTNALVTTLQCS